MSAEPTLVRFREDFSPKLIGLIYEIDDPNVLVDRTPFNYGRGFVRLRIRVGKTKPRWGYRLAYVDDLRNLDGSLFAEEAGA